MTEVFVAKTNYEGLPVFADEDETVRIYDGFSYEGTYSRASEAEDLDLSGGHWSEGPFVLLSDYQALVKRVYGSAPDLCGEEES